MKDYNFALSLSLVAPTAIAFRLIYNVFKLPKQDPAIIQQIMYEDNGRPIVMAHRGGQYEAAENTLLAIETAHHNGAMAVEVDLEFTKDNVAILFHDDTLDRVTDGQGQICDHTFTQISHLNAAKTMNFTLSRNEQSHISITTRNILKERIPKLHEAIELCIRLDLRINLDVKSNAKETVKVLKQLLQSYPHLTSRLCVTSFKPLVVYYVRRNIPELAAGLLFERNSYSLDPKPIFIKRWFLGIANVLYSHAVHTWLPRFLGISFVSVERDLISREYCKQWRSKEIDVIAWTVNHPKEKAFLRNVLKIPIISDTILDVNAE